MCMTKCVTRVVSHPSSVMLHHPIFEANLKGRDHKCRKSFTFFFYLGFLKAHDESCNEKSF